MLKKLPTYQEAEQRCAEERGSQLDWFITTYQPNAPQSVEWRKDLWFVIQELEGE